MASIQKTFLTLAIAATTLIGCAADVVTLPVAGSVTDGFSHPESAIFDAASDTWFVTNIGEFGVPGDGFVSRLDSAGAVMDLHFVDGLDDPKGMAVYGGTLYVADFQGVLQVDLSTPDNATYIEVPGAVLLNDIVVDSSGTLYVSDSFGNAIMRIAGGEVTELVRDTALETPNGLVLDGDTLWIASIGPDVDPMTFQPAQPGKVMRLDLNSLAITAVTERLGSLDGLAQQGDNFLVTDSAVGLYRVTPEGETELIIDNAEIGLVGSADIGFDPNRQMLAVPQLFGTQVSFFTFR